jgi:hypothetical protein
MFSDSPDEEEKRSLFLRRDSAHIPGPPTCALAALDLCIGAAGRRNPCGRQGTLMCYSAVLVRMIS